MAVGGSGDGWWDGLSRRAVTAASNVVLCPLLQTLEGRGGVVAGGPDLLLEPVDEQLLVLLQQQELAEQHVGLVEALEWWWDNNGCVLMVGIPPPPTNLVLQPRPVGLPDAGHRRNLLVAHGLAHELAVLQRCRHDILSLCGCWVK